jgi:hypothetical protein
LGAVYFKAFADELRSEPEARGQIIIHPEFGKSFGRSRVMARLLRNEMVKEHGIDTRRIVIRAGGPRKIP